MLAVRMKKVVFTTCLFVIATNQLFSQELSIQHLSLEDGLSHDNVSGIYQDSLGFTWISTLNGITRYDGQRFRVYRSNPENPHSIRMDNVGNIYPSGEHLLFFYQTNSYLDLRKDEFLPYEEGLAYLNFIKFQFPDSFNIDTLIQLPTKYGTPFLEANLGPSGIESVRGHTDTTAWVKKNEGRLFLFHKKEGTFSLFPDAFNQLDTGLFRHIDGSLLFRDEDLSTIFSKD